MTTYAWRKEGVIFIPNSLSPLLASHAANPLPVHMEGDIYRVFFSGRDEYNRSSVGAFDYDVAKRQVVQSYSEPFFSYGPPGSFFADGVSVGNCYEADGRRYILFMGWQNFPDAHWRGDIGRLELLPDMTLLLDGTQPFIHSDAFGAISLSYPWVERCDGGRFDMWLGVTETWDAGNGEMLHVLRRAESPNGHSWTLTEEVVPYALGRAQAFSRPTLLCREDGTHDMWYSYRSGNGTTYRIGHSRRVNGAWTDAPGTAGIDVSDSGWDSEMIEYPFVFCHGGETLMLYNGNGFGRTGIGLASLVP